MCWQEKINDKKKSDKKCGMRIKVIYTVHTSTWVFSLCHLPFDTMLIDMNEIFHFVYFLYEILTSLVNSYVGWMSGILKLKKKKMKEI